MRNEAFTGRYKDHFEGFLIYKRSLGYRYGYSMIRDMIDLNEYLEAYSSGGIRITEEISHGYIAQKEYLSSGSIHRYESMIRQFSIYLRDTGYPDTYIYPENHIKVTTDFIPYVFSRHEIAMIFRATDRLPEHKISPHNYKIFYQTIIRLLYGSGIRISEALNLKTEEVDLDNNILTISDSKDNVSRLVPFNDDIAYWMKKYKSEHTDNLNYFFEFRKGKKRNKSSVSQQFKDTILADAGIPRKADNTGPRLHDLRHTFACHSLDRMIKSGKDAYCALPYLSTYMGHKGIESTEKYLRLTEEHFKEITEAGKYIYEGLSNEDE